jgi:vacuolar-type H+-ATPase subunit E/Vma4
MTKSTYQIERKKRIAAQAKAMQAMTDAQQEALDAAYKALKHSVSMIRDTNDLYLSDIQAMDDAYWKMYHAFNKEDA